MPSAPSTSRVSWKSSRPIRRSSGASAARSSGSVRAATQTSRATVYSRPVKAFSSSASAAVIRSPPAGMVIASARSSPARLLARCSMVARTSSALLGK